MSRHITSAVSQAFAKFDKEQWAAIFGGDFSYVQGIIEGTNNKIGVALGVKVADDQSLRQVIFNKKTLRQYTLSSSKANKFLYLGKAIDESKANGAYGTTNFGPDDYTIREFSLVATSMNSADLPAEEDVFGTTAPASDDNWMDE